MPSFCFLDPQRHPLHLQLVAGGAVLADRFRAAQVSAVRPGLTFAQDGAGLVLTDNYLRVRLAEERPGNERVRVRITAAEG